MPPTRPRAGPCARALARHVDRLRQSLESLGYRLREAIAQAVGQSVASAVHEAVAALLAERLPAAAASRPPPLWDGYPDPQGDYWEEDACYRPREDSYDLAREAEPSDPPAGRSRWPAALAAGLRAALQVLRDQSGSRPVLTAVGVGLAAAALAFLGGPVAAAGLGLIGSALGLLALTTRV